MLDRFNSDRVVVMHWMIAWCISAIGSVSAWDNSITSALRLSSDCLTSSWNLTQYMRFDMATVFWILPGINVYSAELKFLHDIFEWREAACDMFRLVSKGLQEARIILFTIKADDECFKH